MRVREQYGWNIVFIIFFLVLVAFAMYHLDKFSYRAVSSLGYFDFVILALAAFRCTRLVMYDKITAFFREQFYDDAATPSGTALVKPPRGPRRTLADLLSCPWCFGLWAAATVLFFYLLTPLAEFPIYFLALAGLVTPLQLLSQFIGAKVDAARDLTN